MIPLLLPAAVRHGVIDGFEELGALLLTVSPATMDCLLSEERLSATSSRRRRAGMSSSIRRDVPIRIYRKCWFAATAATGRHLWDGARPPYRSLAIEALSYAAPPHGILEPLADLEVRSTFSDGR